MAPKLVLLAALLASEASGRVITSTPAGGARVKRQISELRDEYDFVIAGAGTAGLTVADRLTEAFPDRSVLVVEPGGFEFATGVFEPASGGSGAGRQSITGQPMPQLNNRTASVTLGRTVGGSSAINGQFFDRACRYDFDDWKILWEDFEEGSMDEESWDWEGILPWYQKSVTFTEPDPEIVEDIGMTWDYEASYGGDTPVHASFPPFRWGILDHIYEAWVETGLTERKDCGAGDKEGICWIPTSQNPWDGTRSTSRTGHYDPVIDNRPNYDILIEHKVMRVLYEDGNLDSPPSLEILPLNDILDPDCVPDPEDEAECSATSKPARFNIKANIEAILSAGAVHTPQILQRSGIGPRHVIEAAGIEVIHELDGVGYNFQDHGGAGVSYRVSGASAIHPAPSDMSNATYAALAEALYALRPAQGPYTTAMGNNAVYVSYPNLSHDDTLLPSAVREQVDDEQAGAQLPPDTPASVIRGYEAQLRLAADGMENPNYPSLESPFSSGFTGLAFLLKPLSRGTVLLDPTDPDGDPLLDWRTCANPLDIEVLIEFVHFMRAFFEGESVQALGPLTEVTPGADIVYTEDMREYIRDTAASSFMHPCCTAAMLPLELGGVTAPDLKVHGLAGLRVVDASIFPTVPGTHLSATVYAIAEKAADIIIRQNALSDADEAE